MGTLIPKLPTKAGELMTPPLTMKTKAAPSKVPRTRKRAVQMKQQAKHRSRNMKRNEMMTARTSERGSHFQF